MSYLMLVTWSDGSQSLQRHKGIVDKDIPVLGDPNSNLNIKSYKHFKRIQKGYYVAPARKKREKIVKSRDQK